MNAKNNAARALALAALAACGGSGGGGNGGAAGATAAAGASGAAGTTASAGNSGAAGATGVAGTTGAAGATATAGATGAAGTTGGAGTTGAAGMTATAGTTGAAGSLGAAGSTGGAGASGALTADQVKTKVDAYKAGHPCNGGKDWDINAKTPAQIAADPAANELLSLCGPGQRPVIPTIAWEYGGADHSWINPQASALVYCVYIPVSPQTDHWKYDSATMRVTADVYVRYADQNPCKAQAGANQVLACLGDPTNIEILVDTASLNDGNDVGLDLACASTDLNLILPDGSKIHLYTGL